jgi:hypothetical protein
MFRNGVRRIINRELEWIDKHRRGFFEGDVMFPQVETILTLVPFQVGCSVAPHSCAIVDCPWFVIQL